jgi:hypothetical protein
LQLLRIKGLAGIDALAVATGADAVDAALTRLAAEGLVERQDAAGAEAWMLTTSGLAEQGRLSGERAGDEAMRAGVSAGYDSFLELNQAAKTLVSEWQQGVPDEAAAIARLEDIGEKAGEALRYAGRQEPRFGRYASRLDAAMDRVAAGEERYVGDPSLDSFHTVWFECHEDFLLTLGLTREE